MPEKPRQRKRRNVTLTAEEALGRVGNVSAYLHRGGRLTPGAHIVVITADVPRDGIQARCSGLELRDSLAIFLPGLTLHALLLRTPLAEKNVASQVLKTGTGALNIDGCRVGSEQVKIHGYRGNSFSQRYEAEGTKPTLDQYRTSEGRWPTNVILIHGPGCVCQGTKRVAGIVAGNTSAVRRSGVHSEAKGHQTIGREQPVTHYADAEGKETVTAWDCQPDCPVKLLDAQSGTLTSGDPTGSVRNEGGNMLLGKGVTLSGFGDSGGASRFYPQFKTLSEAAAWLSKLIT